MVVAAAPILIVTDRYPPDTHGGAEISLHLALSKLHEMGIPISVAALSDQHKVLTREVTDGIGVYRIPFITSWPPQRFSYSGRFRLLPSKRLRKSVRDFVASVDYLTARGSTPFLGRIQSLILHNRLSRSGAAGGDLPIMDRDAVEMGPTVHILRNLIETLRPGLVHADNYRSILYAAAACPKETKLTALVRDNRFYCAERGQATNIDGVICGTCEFGCVPPSDDATLRKKIMRDSMRLRRDSLNRADKVLVTSQYLKEQIDRELPHTEITVVPNPADSPAEVAKLQAGIQTAYPPEILCVGMVNSNKGQLILAELLDFLGREIGDFRLCIAGRGLLLTKISRMAQGLGMSHNLFIPGFLSRAELYKMYARATVVVCPTVWPEPFGRVPLEAGLSRKPTVAFAAGGLTESILDGETGLLVPPGDKEQLGRAIVRVVKEPALAKRLGENAYHHIVRRYSLEQTTNGLLGAWDSLRR